MKILALAILVASMLAAAADLAGVWTISWEPDFGGNFNSYDCTFDQKEQRLTITCGDNAPFAGEIDGTRVTIRFKTGRDGTENAVLTGELDERGRTITGTWQLVEQKRTGKFSAKKL